MLIVRNAESKKPTQHLATDVHAAFFAAFRTFYAAFFAAFFAALNFSCCVFAAFLLRFCCVLLRSLLSAFFSSMYLRLRCCVLLRFCCVLLRF